MKDDPKFAKYFKMLANQVPKEEVAALMKAEKVDPKVLELDPDQPTISRGPVKRTGGGFALPEPPPKYPKKLSAKPPVAMRALFWTRIGPEELDNTVWEKLSDSNVAIDTKTMMELFAKEKPKEESPEKEEEEKTSSRTHTHHPNSSHCPHRSF